MAQITVPEENKETISTRIDTTASDILRKISVEKYGTKSNISAVLTEAVRFLHDPDPVQRAAKQKYANDLDLDSSPPKGESSKVIHWTAPGNIVQMINDYNQSKREFIESCVYEYEAYYSTIDNAFESPVDDDTNTVDWSVIESNYDLDMDQSEFEGIHIKQRPRYRRPILYSLIDDSGISSFDVFNKIVYGLKAKDIDITGLPEGIETRKKDFRYLVDEGYLIPSPAEKSNVIKPIDEDHETYFKRNNLDKFEQILEQYLDSIENWIQTQHDNGTKHTTGGGLYKKKDAVVSTIKTYDVDELEEYADRAEELQKELTTVTKSFA